ncbi:hypothetical protein [Parapedobacter koreensis]|uniref:Uncharacterized protein n=1 Tax=Parapedobacter koreensis TaxID=332977 RepID=A0A1H7TAF3_9SPHI|nr:hypothetical protein [Parapedobacter koreensis]SEL81861.1 hypothetical protein SAMN05421740_110188 [Parapedobacter koreensis]
MNAFKMVTLVALPILSLAVQPVFSQVTKIVIRAKAKDAKFIGTGIGGAYVIVRNNTTGEILDQGYTTGTSGDTELIMNTPIARAVRLTDDNTAKFEAQLTISEPIFVDVEVIAPINRKAASVKATTQFWAIPGKHILGDGIILDIPGYILDINYPTTHQTIAITSLPQGSLKAKVHLVMMCGCVINKGGIWDADDIEVKGLLRRDGKILAEFPFEITDEDNVFEGTLPLTEKGSFELLVYAFDEKTGNSGIDKVSFVIN